MKKLFMVHRPSSIPKFYYTFAENKEEAIFKVSMKFGGLDDRTIVRKIEDDELESLVIGTDYYG